LVGKRAFRVFGPGHSLAMLDQIELHGTLLLTLSVNSSITRNCPAVNRFPDGRIPLGAFSTFWVALP
jgi:hypothetical protein